MNSAGIANSPRRGASEARVEVSVIKFFAAGVLHDVIDRAVQVHGGRGLTDETPLAAMLAMLRAVTTPAEVTVDCEGVAR